HFEIRKNLLKFDNVMNDQRKVIYEQRREIMEATEIGDLVKDMRTGVIEDAVRATIPPGAYAEQWDVEALETETHRLLGEELPIKDWAKEEGIADAELLERILDHANRKMAQKVTQTGPEIWRKIEKGIVLQLLDQHWKEHLLNLDHLKQGINLRAMGQKDPLNEYKTEAFGLFDQMLNQLSDSITMTLNIIEVNIDENSRSLRIPGFDGAPAQQTKETRQDPALAGHGRDANTQAEPEKRQPLRRPPKTAFDPNDPQTWGKVARNADCPCGSGKKFKHCHGQMAKSA
ncbi:MAG: SEC-C metal-binding domain-containing protein, partial [Bdellovibrionales bacterium]